MNCEQESVQSYWDIAYYPLARAHLNFSAVWVYSTMLELIDNVNSLHFSLAVMKFCTYWSSHDLNNLAALQPPRPFIPKIMETFSLSSMKCTNSSTIHQDKEFHEAELCNHRVSIGNWWSSWIIIWRQWFQPHKERDGIKFKLLNTYFKSKYFYRAHDITGSLMPFGKNPVNLPCSVICDCGLASK